MPIFDSPSLADTNEDLIAQQEEFLSRKEMLKLRAARAAAQLGIYAPGGGVEVTQPQGFRSAVTGADIVAPMVKRPALAALAPILAETRDAYDRDQLTQDQSDYRQRAQADAMQRITNMPQGTPYSATPTTPPSAENPGGNLVEANVTPATEPSLRDRLTWAMGLQKNPITAGIGAKLIENDLVQRPEKLEERAYQSSEKEKDRVNAQVVERLKMLRPDLDFQTDNYGNVRAYDKHSGAEVPIKPLAGTATPVGGPGTGANPTPTVGAGKPSGTVDKQIADAQERTRQATNSLQQIDTAHALLKDTVSGTGEAVMSWARKHKIPFAGEPNVKDINDEALKGTAQWLASTFPRGPGDITVAERQMFQRAVANIGDSTVDADVRAGALDIVAELIAKSAGLPIPPKRATQDNSVRASVERLIKERGGEPTGSFTPGTDPSKFDIKDPVERAMAQRAFANQQKAQPKPKRDLVWNPKTGRAE